MPHSSFCFVCVCVCPNLLAWQRKGPADLGGQRGLHTASLCLPTGHPRLGEEHAGALWERQSCVQVQGQEVSVALCRSVSSTGVTKMIRGVFLLLLFGWWVAWAQAKQMNHYSQSWQCCSFCQMQWKKKPQKTTNNNKKNTKAQLRPRVLRLVLQDDLALRTGKAGAFTADSRMR